MNIQKLRWLALAVFGTPFVCMLSPAKAADMRLGGLGNGSYRQLIIEGKIEQGDFRSFLKLIEENRGTIGNIYVFSPGGDFREAMKIGRAMRALELSSMVPMKNSLGQPECGGYLEPAPVNPLHGS